jgi:VIT1/CCC1 family predicted Fe2+/Mn2+ transporter
MACAVALKLMEHDALAAHARDELGISESMSARPLQAAFASAVTFAVGATLPIVTAVIAPRSGVGLIVSALSLASLSALGAIAAKVGASPWTGAGRVAFWGDLAMAATAAIGKIFGTTFSYRGIEFKRCDATARSSS